MQPPARNRKTSSGRVTRNSKKKLNLKEEPSAASSGFTKPAAKKKNSLLDLNGDGLWSKDAALLINDFRDCNIKEFTYSSTCSNANEIAWEFIQNGCTLKGMTMINTTKKIFSEGYDQKPAYIFSID